MLENIDGYLVADDGASASLTTKYAGMTVKKRVSVTGEEELWFHIETKPAFEVACIEMSGDEPIITLMSKRRLVEDKPRIKVPGGYLWGPPETYIPKKIAADTGIAFSFQDLVRIGHVIGHSEIVTPIELYFTTKWKVQGQPKEGIEIFDVSLGEAARMAISHQIENDSSFALIMRLYWLWREGALIEAISSQGRGTPPSLFDSRWPMEM